MDTEHARRALLLYTFTPTYQRYIQQQYHMRTWYKKGVLLYGLYLVLVRYYLGRMDRYCLHRTSFAFFFVLVHSPEQQQQQLFTSTTVQLEYITRRPYERKYR